MAAAACLDDWRDGGNSIPTCPSAREKLHLLGLSCKLTHAWLKRRICRIFSARSVLKVCDSPDQRLFVYALLCSIKELTVLAGHYVVASEFMTDIRPASCPRLPK